MTEKYQRRQQRKFEERKLLYEVFQEGAVTKEQKVVGYRNAKFIEHCLELMKMGVMMGFGTKSVGKKALHETIDNLMERELAERYELGLMELVKVNLSEVKSVLYSFHFKIIKVKSEKLRGGKKPIRYKNEQTIEADSLEFARAELARRLKKLGDTMVEEISVTKRISTIITNTGVHAAYTVEIIDDVNL